MALISRAWIVASFVWPCASARSPHPEVHASCNSELLMDRPEPPLRDQTLLQTRLSTHAVIAAQKAINEERGVNYAGGDGVKEHELDLLWPSGAAPVGGWPAVIMLHGNGQTKDSMYYICRRRAQNGRLCMAPNRDVAISDSILAIDWFFANAAAYDVNVNLVVIYGYSRGGFITNTLIFEHSDVAERMTAAIIVSGATQNHVDMAQAGGPPMLLISCEDDELVKYKHTLNLYDKLYGFGTDVTLWTCQNGHASQKAEGFDEQVDTFLDLVAPTSGTAFHSTTTSTLTPIVQECQDWCANHDVSVACTWGSCSGCSACIVQECQDWCANHDVSVACTWGSCSGCSACSPK